MTELFSFHFLYSSRLDHKKCDAVYVPCLSDTRKSGLRSPVEIIHEIGEYQKNIGLQSRSGCVDADEKYYRQIQQLVQAPKYHGSFYRDRSAGSPSPYAANSSDNTSEISVASEMPVVVSRRGELGND